MGSTATGIPSSANAARPGLVTNMLDRGPTMDPADVQIIVPGVGVGSGGGLGQIGGGLGQAPGLGGGAPGLTAPGA